MKTITLAVALFSLTTFAVTERRAAADELSVGAYGALGYQVARVIPAGGTGETNNGFAISALDLFLRGSAGKFSFLSEVLFDIDEGNEFAFDLDRVQVSYDHADWLKVTVGRFHTSIGYYNTAYPHGGAIFLLPIARPALVEQHDNASILPSSAVGMTLHGTFSLGTPSLSYDLDIANGRGRAADELTNGVDLNNSKMLNLRLRFERSGLIIGGNALVDWIPPRVDMPEQPETLREQIFGAHIAYVEHPWHLIAEGALIQHIGATTYRTLTGLVEAGYTVGQFTPYARFEATRFPAGLDPFWAATFQQARGSFDALSSGIKWMANDSIALKAELTWNHADTDTAYRAATQIAFGF
jgi:hypothetical protein